MQIKCRPTFTRFLTFCFFCTQLSVAEAVELIESGRWSLRGKMEGGKLVPTFDQTSIYSVELNKDGSCVYFRPGGYGNLSRLEEGTWRQDGVKIILDVQYAVFGGNGQMKSITETFVVSGKDLLWQLNGKTTTSMSPDGEIRYRAVIAAKPDDSEPSANPTPGSERVKIDRKGLVEEAILDPAYRAQVEAELEAAQKKWLSDERGKEDNFEKVRKEQIDAWRASLSGGHASFDDHPDVMAIKALTGQQGVLIAPTVARKYDNMLIDRGWYPYADKADDDTEEHLRSFRERYTPQNEIKIPTDIKIDALGISDPDIPVGIDIPSYKAIRDHYLKTEVK